MKTVAISDGINTEALGVTGLLLTLVLIPTQAGGERL